MKISITKSLKFTPVQTLAVGFAVVIFIGAVLLTLPISSASGTFTPFIDSLFTATSATCVTGLVTLDTGTHWSYFGKTVIILLIQIGGFGFLAFSTLFALVLGKKITLRERLVMQEAMNTFNLQGLVKLAKYIFIFTFSVELIGAILLATQFIPDYGLGKGIYFGLFHSISSFCNAGFDLIGGFRSYTPYAENSVVILTVGALIVIGGLGFAVWAEIYNYKGFNKLSLHSKVAIVLTAFLVFGGAVLMFIFEFNNPETLAPLSFQGKITNSLLASITPRTAGCNSIPTAGMSPAGRFLTIILMYIGGSPGSTAGGIKTTTFGIIFLTIITVVKGKEDTEIFKKRIAKELVTRAFIIATLGLAVVIVVTMLLSITEAGASFEYLLYEATSAFGTVGLTLGLTPSLSSVGKIIVLLTMYCGRVGPLTVALALAKKKSVNQIRYPEEKILIG